MWVRHIPFLRECKETTVMDSLLILKCKDEE
jgi:hypothetical protein